MNEALKSECKLECLSNFIFLIPGREKPGFCPKQGIPLATGSTQSCKTDKNCSGDKKCCMVSQKGSVCRRPTCGPDLQEQGNLTTFNTNTYTYKRIS